LANWCHNVLTVSGEVAEVEHFAKKARPTPDQKQTEYAIAVRDRQVKPSLEAWFAESHLDQPLTFEAFAPQPAEIEDWYHWRCEHWGSKWDANFRPSGAMLATSDADVDIQASIEANGLVATPTVLVYRFETAWSPPIEAVAAMARQHPRLEFHLRYGEPGEGIAGEATFAGGELQDLTEHEVDGLLPPEEMWF
jgi:hypothetical protein